MSDPLFLLPRAALATAQAGDQVRLDGAEGRHAADVTRLTVGEALLLADGTGLRAHARVRAVAPGELLLDLVALDREPEPQPRFTLVQALAKGDRDLLGIEVGTELGVDEVVPWQAERSIVRWRGERTAKSHRKWVQTVQAASKQARRARVPEVAPLADRREVCRRVREADLALVLHEEATTPLAGVAVPEAGEVLLVVGPEGGVSPEETRAFVEAGAKAVRLGPTVLRTSTAGAAALAVLSARTRWT